MSKETRILNSFLKGRRIKKNQFDDLTCVTSRLMELEVEITTLERVLSWFWYLHEFEVEGWRNKAVSQKIAEKLAVNDRKCEITFYALFCPSYKKGKGVYGFRTDEVGETTRNGVRALNQINIITKRLGFYTTKPVAIFFDLALEQPEKTVNKENLLDLERNIVNFKKLLKKDIQFQKLSEIKDATLKSIGYMGRVLEPLPVPYQLFTRIVQRGGKFYQLFGWNKKQIYERSRVIASSEYLVGEYLRRKFVRGIMVYTPTMLERSFIYSGYKYKHDPLPIIYPRKGL